MIRQPISVASRIGLGVSCVIVLAAAYTWVSHRQHQTNPRDTTIPAWGQLADGLRRVVTPNEREGGRTWLAEDARATSARLFFSLGVGVLGALVLGTAMGCYTPVEAFFKPTLAFLAKVPPTALLAIFMVLAGVEMKMFVSFISFGIFPSLAQSIYHSARKDVPDELLYKAYTLGASQAEIVWNVVARHVLPSALESIRLIIGPALVFLIAAEMMTADVGFGYRLRLQARLLDMSVVYVYVALLGIAGFGIDAALTALRRKLCPWYGH